MRLESLHLKNVGIVVDETFNFDPNAKVVVISGDNGSGKSTVFDAFRIAALDSYDGALKEFINWNSSEFLIDLRFSILDKRIRSIVRCAGAGAERELIIEGELPYKNSEATKRLAQLLNPKQFLSTSFIRQHEIDVVDVKDSERREYLKKLWDLDLSRSIAWIDAQLASLHTRFTELQSERSILESRSYNFIEHVSFTDSDDNLRVASDSLEVAQRELQSIISSSQRRDSLEAEAARLSQTAIPSKKSLLDEALRKIQVQESELQALESKRDLTLRTQQIEDAYASAIRSLEGRVTSYLEKVETLEAERVRVPVFSQQEHERCLSTLSDAVAHRKMLERKSALAQRGICPECERPFDDAHRSSIDSDLSAAQQEQDRCQAEYDASSQKKERYQKALDVNSSVETRLMKLQRDAPRSEEESSQLKAQRDREISLALAQHESKVSAIRLALDSSAQLISSLEDAVKELESTLERVLEELKHLPERDSSLRKAELESTILRSQEIIDPRKTEAAYNAAADKNNAVTEAQRLEDLDRITQLTGELATFESKQAQLDAAKDILRKELPSYIIAREVKTVESHMNAFIEQVYGSRYRISIEESKDALKILYGPKKADVRRSASGFEKQLFSAAWRYARERMGGLGILFLDEVDSEASDANSQSFYEVILKLPYEQILAVSHRSHTKELLRNDRRGQVFELAHGKIVQ